MMPWYAVLLIVAMVASFVWMVRSWRRSYD